MELTYSQFLNDLKSRWRNGQHLTIVGETGDGKSWLAADILQEKKYVIAFATKGADETLDTRYKGFTHLKEWKPEWHHRKILFWPKQRWLGDYDIQRVQLWKALNTAYKQGAWYFYFDDGFLICNGLNLGRAMQTLYTQMRSEKITLVASMQRPSARTVPVEMYNQARYLLVFRLNDNRDIDTVARQSGIDYKLLRQLRDQLQRHSLPKGKEKSDFIYIIRGRSATIVRNV